MVNPRIVVVGGGYSGVLTAIQLSRQSSGPLDIAIVEPNAELGRGVAYATQDLDHRLNAPTGIHLLYLDLPDHFTHWHTEMGALAADPAAGAAGAAYARRYDYGTYLSEEIARHIQNNPSGSNICHVRDSAVTIEPHGSEFSVELTVGKLPKTDFVVITTSNAPPVMPLPLRNIPRDYPGLIANPWDLERAAHIPENGRVLVVGTGLTMADVVATLTRDRPHAQLTAISRRGLLPTSRPPVSPEGELVESLTTGVPLFVRRHGTPKTVRELLRILREDARCREMEGSHWQVAFDELRDAAHVLWPNLSHTEKARFVRHLWPWYEVHRFRFPPPTEIKLRRAIEAGYLTVMAGRLIDATVAGHQIQVEMKPRGGDESSRQRFDSVVNCTGPERKPGETGDPFLRNLVSTKLLMPNRLGLGIEVDDMCRVLDGQGTANPRLRIVGPLTRGQFGEVNGIPHIVARLNDAMPNFLATLEGVRTSMKYTA